jgi:YgiT-type zinc finger domain-containing protein
MKSSLNIKICPTCGSDKIKRMNKDWNGKYKDKLYTVPSLQYFECPNCGEKIYDKEAMLRIEEKSPALEHKGKKSKAA